MFRAVSLLRNLSLHGKVCLRDDIHAAFVYVIHLLPLSIIAWDTSSRINTRLSLIGWIRTFRGPRQPSVASIMQNLTYLINYHQITRSI